MTLIVLEGPSASGKSTVRDLLIDHNPEWVLWKGENLMRKGHGDAWNDYQRRYHEALHRLYELNPENVIVADRAFTDAVYNSDEQMREEMKRLIACYGDVYVLFFAPVTDEYAHDELNAQNLTKWTDAQKHVERVLKERGSRDIPKLTEIWHRYRDVLQMFPHHIVNTYNQDEFASADEANEYIEAVHEDGEHNPDI